MLALGGCRNIMSSPFVCEVCGADIMIGRHGSGWRHVASSHSGHRVKKIAREDYMGKESSNAIISANTGSDESHDEEA
ncbi:MAG: hypothetical protein ACJAS1_004550 [Oleiphilaceae bacterium]|jgi:hypothetical protein